MTIRRKVIPLYCRKHLVVAGRFDWRIRGGKGSMNRIQVFSGEAGVQALEPAWRSLTARLPLPRHFHHVEWHLALAATFETHRLGQLNCIAVLSDQGALTAVLPIRLVQIPIGPIQLNAMRLVSDHMDHDTVRDIVLSPDLVQTGFLQGLVRHLAEHEASWDVIELRGILEDSLAVAALKHCPQIPKVMTPGGEWGRAEFMACGAHDRPFERLSKAFRQNLRTARNKLKTSCVVFESARTKDSLLALLPEFLEVESSGWKGSLGTSVLKTPAAQTFLRRLIFHFGPIGGCEILLMRKDSESIAAVFGIVTDGIWYIFRTGYDERYHRLSPGHLIIEDLLRQKEAHSRFDVLTTYNAPPWFRAWKPDRALSLFNAYLFRPSPKGAELAKQVAMFLQAQQGSP